MPTYIGGCFAPPLTEERLAAYKGLIDALPASPLKDAMGECHACCAKWWELPESTGGGKPHPAGKGVIVPLEAAHSKALWDHIPWDEQLAMFGGLFDTIDNATQKPLRDAAFHLLWHCAELAKDREPMTNDKL